MKFYLPPIVEDLCERLVSAQTHENERANYYRRVEQIKDACEAALKRAENINKAFKQK